MPRSIDSRLAQPLNARPDAARLLLLGGLLLIALALRPQVVGIGPLLGRVQDDLAVSHAVAGLLATIPVLCMGLFAPVAPPLLRRLGSTWAIALALVLIAAGGLGRAATPPAGAVLALTFVLGAGMGLAGALLPAVVKEGARWAPAFATGVYVTGINLGSALASAGAVPLAEATGGWRGALAVFSAATAVLVVVWLAATRGLPTPRDAERAPTRTAARAPVAWLLVALFSLLGSCFYGLNSWLPDAYVERGWSEGAAGGLVAVLNLAAIPGSLVVPWLADRHGSRRAWLLLGASAIAVGALGLAGLPAAGWLWATLVGLGNGALFSLLLTLPLDVADRPAAVGAVTALMLGVGYCVIAAAPVLLGAARDLTGSFAAALWILGACGVALVGLSATITTARLHSASVRLRAAE